MNKLLVAATLTVFITPVFAQSSSTGVGVGVANSASRSGAVAISGQGGRGGQGGQGGQGGVGVGVGQGGSVTIAGAPAATTSTTTVNGDQTVRNVPLVAAPGLSAAGLETCLGSVSAGVGVVGFGGSFGTSTKDSECNARLNARTLWAFGLRKAALAVMCAQEDVYRAMPDVCAIYLPRQAAGYGPAPVLLSTAPAGSIELIDGKTGKNRYCNDYDEPHKHCRMWADATSAAKPRKHLAAAVAKPVTTPVVAVPEATAVAESK